MDSDDALPDDDSRNQTRSEPDHEDAEAIPADAAWAVAISGGGTRAALFGLGSLLYLNRSGVGERTIGIASVSGGSMLNAYLAARLKGIDDPNFAVVAGDFYRDVAIKGVVRRRDIVVFALLLVSAGVGLLLLFEGIFGSLLAGIAAALAIVGVATLLRGVVISRLMGRRLYHIGGKLKFADMRSDIDHIFTATDLLSGEPVHFIAHHDGASEIYSPAFGNALSESVSTTSIADIVRSSAAFPGGIPPKLFDFRDAEFFASKWVQWFRRAHLGAIGVESSPRFLFLSDGGSWNNLGTDWYADLDDLYVLGRFEMDLSDALSHSMQALLVVDASAPKRPMPGVQRAVLFVPFFALLVSLYRVLSLLSSSSVTGRVDSLRAGSFVRPYAVSVERESELRPVVVASLSSSIRQASLTYPPDADDTEAHVDVVVVNERRLLPRSRRWSAVSADQVHEVTRSTGTVLWRLGLVEAMLLVLHGYRATENQIVGSAVWNGLPREGVELVAEWSGLHTQIHHDRGFTVAVLSSKPAGGADLDEALAIGSQCIDQTMGRHRRDAENAKQDGLDEFLSKVLDRLASPAAKDLGYGPNTSPAGIRRTRRSRMKNRAETLDRIQEDGEKRRSQSTDGRPHQSRRSSDDD